MRRTFNLIPKLHVRKGDRVKVISGEYKGHIGDVLEVFPEKRKALVEGANVVTKHLKPNQQNPNGSRTEMEAPLSVAKLMVIDPKTGTPTRVGRTMTDKGWVRVSKKSGEILK
jgi:large subunit ribosomal protein L24